MKKFLIKILSIILILNFLFTNTSKANDIVEEEYHVNRDSINLYGKITAPSDYKEKKLPLLIISHGFNNTLEMYDDYAEKFAEEGYIVYRFDFFGGSRNSKSGGQDMQNMSILTEKADLEAVINKLSQENFVDKEKINLLGVSQGGVVSTLYASENKDKVNKLLLIFPAFVMFDDLKETYEKLGVSSLDQVPKSISHRNSNLGSSYLTDAINIDINKKISEVAAPTLIIHGTNDSVVPYSYAENANKTFKNSKLVTVENGGHRLDSRFNNVALKEISEFMK
ncbi:MAG: alpha/beta fold hydrolase [Gemella sp.]|nr:alpha/beta fold hydrolase [Gemella sp.]